MTQDPAVGVGRDRLLELASVAARNAHQAVCGTGKGSGHVLKIYGPAGGGFETCPHPDCVLVREEPDSILDVKLWIHEWCQRHGYPGGQATIGVDGAKELLRADRLCRIDDGGTVELSAVGASVIAQPLDPLLLELAEHLAKAERKHAPMRGEHEGWAVIYEELDELWDEVKRETIDPVALRKEAFHTAAMALRFVKDVCAAIPSPDPKPAQP